MFGFIKGLFGQDKVVDAVIDSGDKMFHTSEERAEWTLRYLELTKGQSPARRFIAVSVTLLWIFLILFGLAAQSTGFTEVATYAKEDLEIVSPVFGLIVGFYFVVMLKK